MSTRRPKLGEILRATPAHAPADSSEVPPVADRMVQLNVTVPAELRKAVRMKALGEDRDVTDVVRELLIRWVGD